MAPDAPPSEASGIAERKAVPGFDGRFYQMNVKGMMEMPDADGKVEEE